MGQFSEEDLEDLQAVRRFRQGASLGREELVPEIVLKRLLDGVAPLTVWREHRNLSVEQLAYLANVDSHVVSEIERGNLPVSDESMMLPRAYRTDPTVSAREQSPVDPSRAPRGMFSQFRKPSPPYAAQYATQTSYSQKLASALMIDPEDLLEW